MIVPETLDGRGCVLSQVTKLRFLYLPPSPWSLCSPGWSETCSLTYEMACLCSWVRGVCVCVTVGVCCQAWLSVLYFNGEGRTYIGQGEARIPGEAVLFCMQERILWEGNFLPQETASGPRLCQLPVTVGPKTDACLLLLCSSPLTS